MFQLKEILRLHYEFELSQHEIAKSIKISSSSVNKYLKDFAASGHHWPVSDEILQTITKAAVPTLDFNLVHTELKSHRHMTLQLIFEEYSVAGKTKLSYSHFAYQYRQWKKTQPSSMRQTHIAGEKVFVDYAGPTIPVIDSETGQVRSAQIFVGVLGASNYIYMEATWSQKLENWIGSHVRMFNHLGGVTSLIVPDNLRSAVTKSDRYEPELNRVYAEFARHYSTVIMPARIYRPKDKAKAENGVLIVERWVLMRLRKYTFTGLKQLNDELRRLMVDVNNRKLQKFPGTRQLQFDEIDKPALKALPNIAYEFKQYKRSTVGPDYHVELHRHYYSVPFQYIRQECDIWFNEHTVDIYLRGMLIAKHLRKLNPGNSSSPEHMPEKHKKRVEWTEERCQIWAKSIGIATLQQVKQMLIQTHSENARRSCLGLMSLAKKYGNARLEAACSYGFQVGVRSRKDLISILEHKLEQADLSDSGTPSITHENIRGSSYYA
jgi:transposase